MEKIYHKCDKCTFETEKPEELERHLITHAEVVHFKCSKCNNQCSTNHDLGEHMKVHEVTVYQCSVCKHQFQSAIELKTHKDEKHPVASVHCKDKCKKYDELLPNYNQLKENYERLIQINKKLQSNSKDNEYALEI